MATRYRLKRKTCSILNDTGNGIKGLVGSTAQGVGGALNSNIGGTLGAIGGAKLLGAAIGKAIPGLGLAGSLIGGALIGRGLTKGVGRGLESFGENLKY